MSKPKFNKQQLDAIDKRECSILVSAPAGSGKTQVLVQRIINLIQEGNISIDELIVLTFTKAAALEMKQRLKEKLEELLTDEDHKSNCFIQQQLDLLPNCYITNFDSFCGDIVKQYGNLIGVRTDFKVLTKSQPVISKMTLKCLDRWIEEDDFIHFFGLYFNNNVTKFVKEISNYRFMMENKVNYTTVIEAVKKQQFDKDYHQLHCFIDLKQYLELLYDDLTEIIKQLDTLASNTEYTAYYTDDSDKKCLKFKYDNLVVDLKAALTTLVYTKDTTIKYRQFRLPKTIDLDDQVLLKRLKAEADKVVNKMTAMLYPDEQTIYRSLKLNSEYFIFLDKYTTILNNEYMNYKKEVNQYDYRDITRYCFTLLDEKYDINVLLNSKIKEIMIDEYQDTNQIQEDILKKIYDIEGKETNVFMVGDMKQAIYKFRDADPKIFKSKYDTFGITDNNARINLVFNYRSNKIVLDSINYMFNQLMDNDVGDLEYLNDEYAPLNYDYHAKESFDEDKVEEFGSKRIHDLKGFDTEFLLVDPSGIETPKKELEAISVAEHIVKLKAELKLEQGSELVDCKYKDIACLFRSLSDVVIFKKVFSRFNIPVNIILKNGLFNSNEIHDCVNALSAIYNPHNDIAFLSLFTASFNFSDFNEQLLIDIKTNQVKGSFYNQVKQYIEVCKDKNIKERLTAFIDYLHDLMLYSKEQSVYDVLCKVLYDSDYCLFLGALFNGGQRVANVELFCKLLLEYQNDSFEYGVQEIIYLIESDTDLAPGNPKGLDNDAVTFTTFHSSKGLEFEVVYVLQLSKKFNDKEDSNFINTEHSLVSNIKFYEDVGDFKDIIHHFNNPVFTLYNNKNKSESLSEELRLIYVALTRAKQKLICSSVLSKGNSNLTAIQYLIELQQKVIEDASSNDNCIILKDATRKVEKPIDWLLLSIVRSEDFISQCIREFSDFEDGDILKQNSVLIDKVDKFKIKTCEHAKFHVSIIEGDKLEMPKLLPNESSVVVPLVEVNNDFKFIKKTVSVTEISKDDQIIVKKDSVDNTTMSAADFGTLIHEVFEKITFDDDVTIENELDKLKEYYDDNEYNHIVNYKKKLQNFFNHDVYQSIIKSKYILKEKVISYINHDDQIVHGIIDLLYGDDKEITILDYKTDRVSTEVSDEDLKLLHSGQLNEYREILKEQFIDCDIKICVYYLHINKVVFI